MSSISAIVLGGGQGKRLFPLTRDRAKPAVPIGGKYRLVDIPLSNCIHSGIKQIYVLTQFNSVSLNRHILRTYQFGYFSETTVHLLAAEQTLENTDWFQGTADAVRKHLPHYHLKEDDEVLILSGDQLYRMDYREILGVLRAKKADLVIATIPVPGSEVSELGIMKMNAEGRIVGFREKPKSADLIRDFKISKALRKRLKLSDRSDYFLASMGIYAFRAPVLTTVLQGKERDFGREVIPGVLGRYQTYGFVFNGYWRDIGTIENFYEAGLELTLPNAPFNLVSEESWIYTRPRFLPPSRVSSSEIRDSLVSEGCVIGGATVERSIIGLRSVVRKDTVIRRSIILGADFYEEKTPRGELPLGIGEKCEIERAILDKNVRIGRGVKIINRKGLQNLDNDSYCIRDGIVIIPKGASIPPGTVI